MSDIKSKPYSSQGRQEWDRIFRGVEPVKIVTSSPEAIQMVREATTRQQVEDIRRQCQELVANWVETDRMNFWRNFNAAVPRVLE